MHYYKFPMKNFIEIACFDYESAKIAAYSGASRIEYCQDYSMGGKTPDFDSTKRLLTEVKIPTFVMLRIGSGFHFNNNDYEIYKNQISHFKSIGVQGMVIGFLNNENEIDISFNQALLNLIKPLPCTFHRAIDYTSNYHLSIQQVIDMGFDRILTSGGKGNAPDFLDNIKIAQKTFGNKIIIMPGGGIRSHNLNKVIEITGCKEFHSAAMLDGKINSNEIKQLVN